MGQDDRATPDPIDAGDELLAKEKALWTKFRTCSRVNSGPCDDCKALTYFSVHVRRVSKNAARSGTLCARCFEKRYDRDAFAKRLAEDETGRLDKIERMKFAREEVRRRAAGLPPVDGWHREGALIVNDETGEKRGFF